MSCRGSISYDCPLFYNILKGKKIFSIHFMKLACLIAC
jgi:hypothetical protein